MTEKPIKATLQTTMFDAKDAVFWSGMLILGIGLSFAISWPVALSVVGALMILISILPELADLFYRGK